MRPEQRPERITFTDTVRSLVDLGKLAVAEVLNAVDTRYANAINNDEDEK